MSTVFARFSRPGRTGGPAAAGPSDDVPGTPDAGAAPVTRPGWGIAADLTPPEVVGARQLTVLRRGIGAGLATTLALCAGGYLVTVRQHAGAADGLAAEQARTASLRAESQQYAAVTTLEGTARSIDTQVATLMAGDVDVVTLLQRVHASLPTGMTLTTETISLEQAGAAAVPTTPAPGTTIDGSATSIGTVTLAGEGRHLDDLATFVATLGALPGVTDVVPTSNTRTESGVQYAVSFRLTEAARSHRFDQGDRT